MRSQGALKGTAEHCGVAVGPQKGAGKSLQRSFQPSVSVSFFQILYQLDALPGTSAQSPCPPAPSSSVQDMLKRGNNQADSESPTNPLENLTNIFSVLLPLFLSLVVQDLRSRSSTSMYTFLDDFWNSSFLDAIRLELEAIALRLEATRLLRFLMPNEQRLPVAVSPSAVWRGSSANVPSCGRSASPWAAGQRPGPQLRQCGRRPPVGWRRPASAQHADVSV